MYAKIFLLIFVLAFLFRTDHSFEQDLGRHLKLGEIIIQTHQVPRTNLFSYTNPDFPFINTHWLFEVLVYLINQTIGLQWMLILKVVIISLSIWLTIKTIPKTNTALLLPIGFIFLHVLRERLELRPEIFSFLFTSLTLYILDRFIKKGTKWIFVLPLIQLVWINTHIYFFVGLILQVTYIIYIGYQKLRSHPKGVNVKIPLLIFIPSVLVSFINPNGLAGVLYPLDVNKNYGYTIVENQTMFLLESINFKDPNFLWVKISAGLVVLSTVVSLLRRNVNLKNYLLAASGLVLALLNVRSFPYLVFLSLPAVLKNLGEIKKTSFTLILSLITCLLLLLESFFYLNGDYYKYTDSQHQVGLKFIESGKNALDFVITNNLDGPIYNNFDIGSYIIYRGYPKYQVFVDGRPEAYPASFFQQTYIPTQADYAKFKELESKWNFKTIIFSHTDQTPWGRAFLQNLVKDKSWQLIYMDDFMIVLTKDNLASMKNLTAVDLSKFNPSTFNFDNHVAYLRIAFFLFNTSNNQAGEQFIRKTLQLFPDDPLANQTNSKFFW